MDEASAAATVVAMLSPSKRGRPAGGTSRQRPSKYRKSEDDSIELYSNKEEASGIDALLSLASPQKVRNRQDPGRKYNVRNRGSRVSYASEMMGEDDEKVPKGNQTRKHRRKQSHGKKASDRAPRNSGLFGSSANRYLTDTRTLGARSGNLGAVNEKQIALKHFLGSGGWRFCSFEFLKSKWDAKCYNDSAMTTLVQKCGLKATHFHKFETSALRDLLGRPRRLSWKFLRDSRLDASVRRQKLDEESNHDVDGNRFGFEVGQNVIAIHPVMQRISDGVILTVSKTSCRVQFDRSDLGVHMVPIENMMEKASSPMNERHFRPPDSSVKVPTSVFPRFLDSSSLADIASLLDSKEHLIGKAKLGSIKSSSKQEVTDLNDVLQRFGAVNSLLNKSLPLVRQNILLTKANCRTEEEMIKICEEESKKLFEECERKLQESNNSGQTVKYWQILDPSEDDETEQHGINTKNIIKLSREYRTSLARLIKGMIQLLLLLTSTGSVDPEMFSSILQELRPIVRNKPILVEIERQLHVNG
eukprot:jgi/Picsp_1/6494/NSC_03838-R1_protein always early 3-like